MEFSLKCVPVFIMYSVSSFIFLLDGRPCLLFWLFTVCILLTSLFPFNLYTFNPRHKMVCPTDWYYSIIAHSKATHCDRSEKSYKLNIAYNLILFKFFRKKLKLLNFRVCWSRNRGLNAPVESLTVRSSVLPGKAPYIQYCILHFPLLLWPVLNKNVLSFHKCL